MVFASARVNVEKLSENFEFFACKYVFRVLEGRQQPALQRARKEKDKHKDKERGRCLLK